jgi:4-amino-4-deoxy-L-arabinose transferase-like glycosyltransferase
MKKTFLILILILSIATFLRFFKLSSLPPALNWDEVSHGFNAYSIITSGKDEWGQRFPLTAFRAYGDYKLPLYIYLTAPFTLFGLNEWTVRLVSALSGIGSVALTFFLVQKLFKNYKVSFLASLLLAISPWHIMLSRAAFEANLALFLVIFGTWLFFCGLGKKTYLLLAFLVFGLTFFTYNSAKIFVPILVFTLIIFYKKEFLKNFKVTILCACIFLALLAPHLVLLLTSEGQARFFWSMILDQGAINRINELRSASNLPSFLPAAIYNKPIYFLTDFFRNWVSHFSPDFLFFKGGNNFQYSIPGRGLMFLIEAPFLVIGFFGLLLSKKKNAALVLVWFAIGPIAASVTRDSPNVLRSILILPSPQVISAFGFVIFSAYVLKFGRKYYYLVWILFFFSLVFFLSNFLFDYFGDYRKNYSFAWQYGYKDVAGYINENYKNYDNIIITKKYGEPHEFLLFYLKWSPQKYQKDQNLIRYFRSNWYWVDRFDKFYFVNDWEIKEKAPKIANGRTLLITSPDNFPNGAEKIKTIYFLDSKKAFEFFKL